MGLNPNKFTRYIVRDHACVYTLSPVKSFQVIGPFIDFAFHNGTNVIIGLNWDKEQYFHDIEQQMHDNWKKTIESVKGDENQYLLIWHRIQPDIRQIWEHSVVNMI